MDNEIKKAYDRGIRAVYRDGLPEFIDQRYPDDHYVWSSIDNWIALRAYQDEQRKKGVPIRYKLISNAPEWTVYSETSSDQFGFIEVGRFTNFRWRTGHPTDSELTFLKPKPQEDPTNYQHHKKQTI